MEEGHYVQANENIISTRRQRLEEETKLKGKWPWLIIIINGILWGGTLPTLIMLAVFSAGKQPSFADDVDPPISLWIINIVQFFANIFGVLTGLSFIASENSILVRRLFTGQVLNVFFAFASVVLQVVSVIEFQGSDTASDHPWTLAIFSVYSVYQVVWFTVWGIVSYGAFTLRTLCTVEPCSHMVRTK
eukprot:TRINITY_DN19731_c0_g1_i1.p1 TRINITY_DN19731_c0_g1~~TRINITY_DN19731_c0_g1_i1.p1  ORF type:complete len:189 (+),score=14.28 TRINITY_DN19731_c0_g1_i1:50-616(+)